MSAKSNRQRREQLYGGAHIPDTPSGPTGDANVVDGHALARVVNAWCAEWEAERPYFGSYSERVFYGPNMYLADHTGLNLRVITAIRRGYQRHVGMGRADRILQAMDVPVRLEDELEPYKNPSWSMERWHAYMAERVGEGCW